MSRKNNALRQMVRRTGQRIPISGWEEGRGRFSLIRGQTGISGIEKAAGGLKTLTPGITNPAVLTLRDRLSLLGFPAVEEAGKVPTYYDDGLARQVLAYKVNRGILFLEGSEYTVDDALWGQINNEAYLENQRQMRTASVQPAAAPAQQMQLPSGATLSQAEQQQLVAKLVQAQQVSSVATAGKSPFDVVMEYLPYIAIGGGVIWYLMKGKRR